MATLAAIGILPKDSAEQYPDDYSNGPRRPLLPGGFSDARSSEVLEQLTVGLRPMKRGAS